MKTVDNGNVLRKVIIVGNGYTNSVSDDIFRDVIENKVTCAEYYYLWNIENVLINFLRRAYYKRKWGLYKKFPFFARYFKKYNAFEKIKNTEKDSIVIVNLASQYSNLTTKDELLELKKSGVVLVLFCVDAIESPQMNYGEVVSWFPIFDLVISDTPEDAKKYNLYYHMDPFPYNNKELPDLQCDNDLYFLGRGKDRIKFCKDIACRLDRDEIKYDFTIIQQEKVESREGIKYRADKVPYREIINGISRSNCILEILSYNNSASLRYFEAIVFNKKLLTNNQEAASLPFFNPDYMKIINSPDDIDVEWLKRKENINYHYKGEFSPSNFIEDVRREISHRGL